MIVVYAREPSPPGYARSIYLAGPTPRSQGLVSWRASALQILEKEGYDDVVYVPEPRDGHWTEDYSSQIDWEEASLHRADCILFWLPRDLETLPGLTTNIEFGMWCDSGKVVFGAPKDAPKNRYLLHYAEKYKLPTATTLAGTVQAAVFIIGEGAWRLDCETDVPLGIWRTRSFQDWYQAQKRAGNRLEGARVVWTFYVGPARDILLYYALHVNLYIPSENRHKSNEVLLSRPDIAAIVMYRRAAPLENTDIVLIREIRAPAATADGYVWELPSGSSAKPDEDPRRVAIKECEQETGLRIDANRMREHLPRQLVAAMSTHKAHLFSVEITNDELDLLRSQDGVPFGVSAESERTYVQVLKLIDIFRKPDVDWSMVGMILEAVLSEKRG